MTIAASAATVGIAVELVLIAEHAEREQDEIEVTVLGEGVVDHLGVRRRVASVERDDVHLADPRVAESLDGAVGRRRVAGREHHAAGATGREGQRGGHGDLGRASEHEDRLHVAERVTHRAGPPGCRSSRRIPDWTSLPYAMGRGWVSNVWT